MPKYATKDERLAKTIAWLSQKVEGAIPDCETCRWFRSDKDHCIQYSSQALHWMCLRIRQDHVRKRINDRLGHVHQEYKDS